MSECVVRMEMPTKDRMCQMADDIDGVWYCPVMKKLCRQPDNGEMPSWCPIICSLPEGHGRLVDAGELKAKQQEDADLFINAYTLMEKSRRDEALNAVANIVNAPTIVPAEVPKEK